jgi:hypothetical protein
VNHFKLLVFSLILFLFSACKKSADTFNTSSSNPVPVLLSVSPNNIVAGSTDFSLTVTGSGFVNGSVVKWNNTALNSSFIDATHLSATVPASAIAVAGTAALTIFSPGPGGGTSNYLTFTISGNAASPVINSILPDNANAGSGPFTLVVDGAHFTNSSVINWNGTALTTTFVSNSQLSATIPGAFVLNTGTAAVIVSNTLPIAGNSNAVNFVIHPVPTGKKILFDASHAETAGNADWVIDEDASNPQRIPSPAASSVSSSTPETYWTGALSSWAIALVNQGNVVETLPVGTSISYGNSANAQDLSNYDVFVVDEPNRAFTNEEKTAILNFVSNGGGLFMVADHTQSDRDFDGWDSPAIWNDLMMNNSIQTNPFGFSIDLANFSGVSTNVSSSGGNIILNGTQGNVVQLEYNNGTSATLTPSANPDVKGLIWQSSVTQTNNNVLCLSSTYGNGRVFFIGDSSPLDDGTGDAGNVLFASWTNYSHANLFMNATLWLARLQ